MVLVIWSCVFGVLAEAALVANWRILAASDAASEGIVQFVWVWPITWGSFAVLGILTLLVASGLSTDALDRSDTRTAVVMILRLLAPILLVIDGLESLEPADPHEDPFDPAYDLLEQLSLPSLILHAEIERKP